MVSREEILAIDNALIAAYPDAKCALDFRNPFELLVATVLSARCTDARVNTVTPALFAEYPTPFALAAADEAHVAELIAPTGFQHTRAANLVEMARALVAEGGEVPSSIDALMSLPGVGRKTAHVVRGNAFGIPGLSVDTHFQRVCTRLGVVDAKTPLKMEQQVAAALPPERWTGFSHRVITHGREVCVSRRPRCERCPVARLCKRVGLAAN